MNYALLKENNSKLYLLRSFFYIHHVVKWHFVVDNIEHNRRETLGNTLLRKPLVNILTYVSKVETRLCSTNFNTQLEAVIKVVPLARINHSLLLPDEPMQS